MVSMLARTNLLLLFCGLLLCTCTTGIWKWTESSDSWWNMSQFREIPSIVKLHFSWVVAVIYSSGLAIYWSMASIWVEARQSLWENYIQYTDKSSDWIFHTQTGQEFPAVVEFAPFQKVSKKKLKKKDAKAGSIEEGNRRVNFHIRTVTPWF